MNDLVEPKVGDLVWVCGFFDPNAIELGEVKLLFDNDKCSPTVVSGICQNSERLECTKFFIDLSSLKIFDLAYINGNRVFYATPKNNP